MSYSTRMIVGCIASIGLLATAGCETGSNSKDEEAEAVESEKQASKDKEKSKDESKDKSGSAKQDKSGDKAEGDSKGPKKAVVGEPAPDFKLKDETGKMHQLSDYKGKMVVLEWTNPKCPYVQRHYDKAKTMMKTHEKIGSENVKWLAVDSSHFNTPKKSKEWKEKHGFDFPILQDKEGQVGKIYGAKTTPHMYVIDKEGVLRYKGAIDDDPQGDKKYEKRTNYVLSAVQALKNGKDVSPKTTDPYGCSVKYAKK